MPSLMRDAAVLVLTSDNEGMPNVVFEALACGLPVVATDVGNLARMVPRHLRPARSGRRRSGSLQPSCRVLAQAPRLSARRGATRRQAMAATHSLQAMADGPRRPLEGRDAGRIPAKGRAPSRTSGSCLLRC